MAENKEQFQYIFLFLERQNVSKMQKKMCAMYGKAAIDDFTEFLVSNSECFVKAMLILEMYHILKNSDIDGKKILVTTKIYHHRTT